MDVIRCAQHWLHDVYGHTGNLGNECADHAAALGTLGLVSSRNLATRWARHNFDTSACFGSFNNIGDVLVKLRNIRTETTSLLQDGSKCRVHHRAHDFHARIALHVVYSQPSSRAQPFTVLCCTVSESWKAQLRVLLPLRVLVKVSNTTCGILLRRISGVFEPFVDEIDLAKIALSCHFALDVLCYKGVHDST